MIPSFRLSLGPMSNRESISLSKKIVTIKEGKEQGKERRVLQLETFSRGKGKGVVKIKAILAPALCFSCNASLIKSYIMSLYVLKNSNKLGVNNMTFSNIVYVW